MSGITQAEAESQLALWLAASQAVATGQSYSIGNRSLTRADASEIREMISFWDKHVQRTSGNRRGPRARSIIPVS